MQGDQLTNQLKKTDYKDSFYPYESDFDVISVSSKLLAELSLSAYMAVFCQCLLCASHSFCVRSYV